MTEYNALIQIETDNQSSLESYQYLKLSDQQYLVLYQDDTWPESDPTNRFNKRDDVDSRFTDWHRYCLLFEAQDIRGLITAVNTYGSSWFKSNKQKVITFLNGVNTNE